MTRRNTPSRRRQMDLADHSSSPATSNPSWWRPNPIDVTFLHWIRGNAARLISNPRTLRVWDSRRAQVTEAFDLCIRSLCDIQLLTGFGILISGYNALECGLSAYHWQVVVFLAWFTCVTHMIGLTTLRRYLYDRPWEKVLRYVFALVLLGMLLAAFVPTAFFDWDRHGNRRHFTLAEESSPAICYFNFLKQRRKYAYDADQSCDGPCGKDRPQLGQTHALQSMTFSSALLIASFVVRTVRLFRFLSVFANSYLHKPLGPFKAPGLRLMLLMKYALVRLRGKRTGLGSTIYMGPRGDVPAHNLNQMFLSAILLSFRINADLVNSVAAEVHWLCILLFWGTVRLASALSIREHVVRDAESAWTFGRVLPVILLAAPIVTALETFRPSSGASPGKQGSDGLATR
ncbi:hypothetical protein F5Y17DRAFT_217543 [Xylariaceae sp. FL0594]|nr:hypothetical protein F5Y17DRAFT_217543 [Xylariaceae sp. FL0594]